MGLAPPQAGRMNDTGGEFSMAAIDFSDTTSLARDDAAGSPLGRAAMAALAAPSILNTQPWRWRIHHGAAELWADRGRQLHSLDPDGRLLILSCGIALHHATVALAAAGHRADIGRLPDPSRPDLLAVVRADSRRPATPTDMRAYQSMLIRHTDRRAATGPERVPSAQLGALRDAVEEHGIHLHLLHDDQVYELIRAAYHAAEIEAHDPGFRDEIASWTHRAPGRGDGVPVDTVVPATPRRVPARAFVPDSDAALAAGSGTDKSATYAILFTDVDTPAGWLAAGEALSELMITATQHAINVNPMSDVAEVTQTRSILYHLLANLGHPMLALRLTINEHATPIPATPRREPAETITDD